ncbi:MAG: hypothetical protein KGV44_09835 [Flavobacteriaceae bacterium]|nr:hypothetical protein [Flavobacteriaceae bacterium]
MKTIDITITKPQLEIYYDDDTESPREWSNLGLIVSKQSIITDEECKPLVQDLINSQARNIEEHLQEMEKIVADYFDSEVVFSIPLLKYEHSGVKYYAGYNDSGWDCGCVGFVFVTESKLKEMGTENDFDKISQSIDNEMETLTQWVNNEVYRFVLLDEQGEEVERCTGFYDLEHIKEYLPKEWQNEDLEQYIQYN